MSTPSLANTFNSTTCITTLITTGINTNTKCSANSISESQDNISLGCHILDGLLDRRLQLIATGMRNLKRSQNEIPTSVHLRRWWSPFSWLHYGFAVCRYYEESLFLFFIPNEMFVLLAERSGFRWLKLCYIITNYIITRDMVLSDRVKSPIDLGRIWCRNYNPNLMWNVSRFPIKWFSFFPVTLNHFGSISNSVRYANLWA